MIVGFTGTQIGCTPPQLATLQSRLEAIHRDSTGCELHHGDCVGADAEAHMIAVFYKYRTVCHPPDKMGKRAFTLNDVTLDEKPYLDRNKDIVDACGVLLACPKAMYEEQRSGTWSTVRYARKQHVSVLLVWPDGTIFFEHRRTRA